MVCSVKSIVMAWSYLRILDGNETTCIGWHGAWCRRSYVTTIYKTCLL